MYDPREQDHTWQKLGVLLLALFCVWYVVSNLSEEKREAIEEHHKVIERIVECPRPPECPVCASGVTAQTRNIYYATIPAGASVMSTLGTQVVTPQQDIRDDE